MIEDFIGVYDNVVSPDFCHRVIEHYEALEQSRLTYSRQDLGATKKTDKDGGVYFLTDDDNIQRTHLNVPILQEFHRASSDCVGHYIDHYGILKEVGQMSMNYSVQLQKTPKSGGYHIWHCEHGKEVINRVLFVQLYLNDINDGGETEFLYQSKRINAVQGRMLICPAGFTHTHRGNPPLKGNKFTINSWVEFV